MTPDSDVYTITDDSLPSHMRSLLPSHERHVQDLLLLERRRHRVRCGLSWLATLLLLTVVVVVAVLLGLHALPAHQGSAPLSREVSRGLEDSIITALSHVTSWGREGLVTLISFRQTVQTTHSRSAMQVNNVRQTRWKRSKQEGVIVESSYKR